MRIYQRHLVINIGLKRLGEQKVGYRQLEYSLSFLMLIFMDFAYYLVKEKKQMWKISDLELCLGKVCLLLWNILYKICPVQFSIVMEVS